MTAGRLVLFSVVAILTLFSMIFIVTCDTSSQIDLPLTDDTVDDDTGDDDTAPPSTPTVDDPVSPTTLSYQSFRGTAEPGATVHVKGGLADAQTTATDAGGFCLRVALNPNANNALVFTASNKAGESGPTRVWVDQQTINYSAVDGAGAFASSTSYSKPENVPDEARDGDKYSWWENTTQTQYEEACYDPQWLGVKLDQTYFIDKIDLFWGKGDIIGSVEYATNYDIYALADDVPDVYPHEVTAEELPSYGYVQMVHLEQSEDIEENLHDLSPEFFEARWIFLTLHEGNVTGILKCSGRTIYSFEVAEMEIYGALSPDEACE